MVRTNSRHACALALLLPLIVGASSCPSPYDGYNKDGLVNYTWLLYNDDGKPAVREQCTIRYKINKANGTFKGLDGPGLMQLAIAYIGAKSGVEWTFDGYTNDTSKTTAGSLYMNKTGVLIEFKTVGPGIRAWSQPKPAIGPKYVAGLLWYDLAQDSRNGASANDVLQTMEHEVMHQYGLGDLYSLPVKSRRPDPTQKMYDSSRNLGTGDLNGLRAATAWARANCK